MSAGANAPIIIKRKKVIEGGHHGGAWKVAYADFVTAMMAFFLLMWLLGATNEKQRKGIADYFNPTIPVNKVSGGGDGAFGGDSIFSESSLANQGTGASMLRATDRDSASGSSRVDEGEDVDAEAEEAAKLDEVAAALMGVGGESLVSELLARHIITRLSDEGLIVEIFDLPEDPLFTSDADATDTLETLIRSVNEVFRRAKNSVAIHAHTASVPVVSLENTVWERSAGRTNTVRKLLLETGLELSRIARITGYGDSQPVTRDPLAVRNNRIEIILLRSKL
ncbi:MAG: OmpA family protein [Boseongicola sp.]|nr:MAG: OmpA family protein [Boseongicola sp.]